MANIAQHKYNIHYVQLFFHSKICPEEVYTIQYSLCRVQRSGAEDGAEDGAGRSRPFFNSGSG